MTDQKRREKLAQFDDGNNVVVYGENGNERISSLAPVSPTWCLATSFNTKRGVEN
jgi:hypothetical protein